MKRPRTLVIGLDGATLDLVEPWARAGHLPTLARLMAEGVRGPLRAWPNLNSAAAWTSMVTGYNPGQHGIFGFGDAPPQRGQEWRPATASSRGKDPFWRLLSAAGQHVGIVNVPISYPADPVRGFMLSGMDAPSLRSPGFEYPPGLLDELRRQGIDYILDVPNLGVLSQRDPRRLPGRVRQMVDARARTVLHLMNSRAWDALMAVFVATDRVQHHFWPLEAVPPEHGDWMPIRLLYQQLDAHLACMLDHIDENTTVLIVSDHGFGPWRPVTRCLNLLFAHLGLLHYSEGGGRFRGGMLGTLLHHGRRIIPQRLQLPLAKAFPGLWLRAVSERSYESIEWSQTQAFANWEGVYINALGRQPEGTVLPEDYHSLRERIRDILLGLTEPAAGRRLIRAVHRPEDVYHGPYLHRTADLLVEWEEETPGNAVCYQGDGEPVILQASKRDGSTVRWRAGHRSQGIFVAWGPQIQRGVTVHDATLYDIAPTILYLQGHPVPSDVDGKVLTDIFTQEHLRHHAVQYSEPQSAGVSTPGMVLDAKEARRVENRLRGLGYIE